MSDEKTYPARTIVKAIQHLRTLSLEDMLAKELIDMDRVIEQMPVSSYRVVLTYLGERKIGAIKVVREYSRANAFDPAMGLAEAKALVDAVSGGARATVLTTTIKARAIDMQAALTLNGSTAHIETDH